MQVSNIKTRKSKQKSNSEDVRSCQFCGELGDKGQGGRLLHFRHNEWVHVNCALWSSEVYEEVDGSLQNVGQALTRGLKLNCTLCSKKGASIGKNTTFQGITSGLSPLSFCAQFRVGPTSGLGTISVWAYFRMGHCKMLARP